MGTIPQGAAPVEALARNHVVTPIAEAQRAAERERAEVRAERRAFAAFGDRVADVDAISTTNSPPTASPKSYRGARNSGAIEDVRCAFLETVLSVDHYDEVYGESLVEHAASELSTDVAAGLRRASGTRFTDWYKSTLTSAIDDARSRRVRFGEQLDAELASLDENRSALTTALANPEGPIRFARSDTDLENELERIATSRQETIRQQRSSASTDGHEFCEYLYRTLAWTYPVLEAITRFRSSVVR